MSDKKTQPCPRCDGEGAIHTGIDEAPTTLCSVCDGTGEVMRAVTCISPLATRPVLYTDTVGGKQTCRDDLWAVTTDELNDLHKAVEQAKIIADIQAARIKRMEEQMNGFRPDFLLNGARFKLNFSTRGNVDVFHNYAQELQGRWVALVPAEDDAHLAQKGSK